MDTSAAAPAGRNNSSTINNASSASSASTGNHPSSLATAIAAGPNIERSPSRSSMSHRRSFAENLRNAPPSPRSVRHMSQSQIAIQDLVNHPPPQHQANPRFAGRDWREICLGELIVDNEVCWAQLDTSVEGCTKILLRSATGVVLLRNSPTDKAAVATFDHRDLNAYLLVVIGLANPEPEDVAVYEDIARRARERVDIPVRDIQCICHKDPISVMPVTQSLPGVIELFGSGVRRILIEDPGSSEVVGVLSQLRLLEFFWNESINFPTIDRLYPMLLRDLRIGSHDIISINADRPLADALTLMNTEGLTSVAVVDNGFNVVGNISTTDVEHLTSVTSFPLLHASCMHFISVILSERGVEEGRDSFPVFYVNPHSTLAHTVAKLVATRSHRMWVVDTPSPSPSAPQTPLLAPVAAGSVSNISLISPPSNRSSSLSVSSSPTDTTGFAPGTVSSPTLPAAAASACTVAAPGAAAGGLHSHGSVPAAALPGAHLSGRLTGVVSLTDILNLFAKTTGLRPSEPADIRARRRRSSSSSIRPSFDGSRASLDLRR